MEGANSRMEYLINCNNFCKCHNVPHPALQLKKIKKKENVVHICNGILFGHKEE
jgi:hypothetical protein